MGKEDLPVCRVYFFDTSLQTESVTYIVNDPFLTAFYLAGLLGYIQRMKFHWGLYLSWPWLFRRNDKPIF